MNWQRYAVSMTTRSLKVDKQKEVKSVFIVGDHQIVRYGLAQMINAEEDLRVCGEAEEAQSAMRMILEYQPQIVILDISLKNSNGLELVKDLKVHCPDIPTLAFSMQNEEIYAERALKAGAMGYLIKEEIADQILLAIRRVLQGEMYLSGRMSESIMRKFVQGNIMNNDSWLRQLTDRELEVFNLIGNGMESKSIAHKLNLSTKTIDVYRTNIRQKLGLSNSVELAQKAYEWVKYGSMSQPKDQV